MLSDGRDARLRSKGFVDCVAIEGQQIDKPRYRRVEDQ
jgi:hypothetical protein